MRKACREEIRKGANFIKIMASGGVSSPTDRISSTQFAEEEVAAAVEEAEAAELYVAAHVYTARAANRVLRRLRADGLDIQLARDGELVEVPLAAGEVCTVAE